MSEDIFADEESKFYPSPDFLYATGEMAKDMKFLGIIGIIGGILYSLTITGALLGIPVIFASLRLKESAELMGQYVALKDTELMQQAMIKMQRFFYIYKILAIITIVITILSIIAAIVILSTIGFGIFNQSY